MSGQTLFEKYGGFAKISRVVMAFYDTLLDSDEVGPFFDDVDMRKLVDHQTKFVSSLLGGPASYTDERLQQLHAHLEIGHGHFDEMKRVLGETLSDHGFAAEDVASVMGEIEARRILIVTRP
jgi:hemoglobin